MTETVAVRPTLVWNGDEITMPEEGSRNCYMGLGMWSRTSGLSVGLPIDVIHMLVLAKVATRWMGDKSKLYILIADGMAISEGADPEEVRKITEIYKRSLQPYIDMLFLKAKIVCFSDIETLIGISESYTARQTAVTKFMKMRKGVGVKIGWKTTLPFSEHCWDERRFDKITGRDLQYLYSKAGLKICGDSMSQVPPYSGGGGEGRDIIGSSAELVINRGRINHWVETVKACSDLIKEGEVGLRMLPVGIDLNRNRICGVKLALNHWIAIK